MIQQGGKPGRGSIWAFGRRTPRRGVDNGRGEREAREFMRMERVHLFARAHVDAMWHSGPRGNATQTRASACVALR